MSKKELLIIGAGPVGLSAALFLHNKAHVRLIEKRLQASVHSKAFGVNPRTLELLEHTGATELFLRNGRKMQAINIYNHKKVLIRNDFSKVSHKYPFMLIQSQADSEAILEALTHKRGIAVERGIELLNLTNHQSKTIAEVSSTKEQAGTITTDIVLAADGAHSTSRKSLSIPFVGDAFEEPWKLYDIELETPINREEAHGFMLAEGALFMVRIEKDVWRIISNIIDPLAHLPNSTTAGQVHWQSEFSIHHRMIASFSKENVYFAGDAAHIHSGLGARGMNLGIEDAYVFAELLQEGNLSYYDSKRKKVVEKTISQVHNLTDIMRGKSLKSKIARRIAPFLMPIAFPLVRKQIVHFVLGLDHEV